MFIVEGNIGAGKSTILAHIKETLSHIEVIFEPRQNWQESEHGQSLLGNFYQDPKRWAYTIETLTMICRVQDHIYHQQSSNPLRVLERSIYSGHYCFAYNDYSSGFLSDTEWHMYHDWFSFLIPARCLPPKGFIYLRVEPQVAYNRVKERNRSDESTIPLEYLKQIHDRHEDFLIKKQNLLPDLQNVPVLVLDANPSLHEQPEALKKNLKLIEEFVVEYSLS